MDLDALAAAGLSDPAAPDAPGRADLLAYLVEHGATIDELVASNAGGNLSSLVFDRRLSHGDLTPVDVADATGTPVSYTHLTLPTNREV